ncbi:MAG: glycosyltransferase [Longimicrobiales bacterium]|nr:glycosyltransferase [Longimicrobiales bacterium]
MAAPLHVLIYEPYPWGQVSGNLQTLTFMLKHVSREAVRFTLMVPFDGGFLDLAKEYEVETVEFPPPDRVNQYGGAALRGGVVGRLRTVRELIAYNFQIRRYLKDNAVDVVYANSVRTAVTVGLGARLAGVPMHLYIKGELDNPVIDHVALPMATRITFFSEQNRDDRYPMLIRMLSDRIDILPPGLDPDVLMAAEHASDIDDLGVRGEKIAYVGQVFPAKGVHFLLEAFGKIAPRFPEAQLVLIGDPMIDAYRDYPDQLKQRAEELGVSDRVHFPGWRRDVLQLLRSMDILVHPTLAEGFGRAVLEAMAMCLPVVASKVGGLRSSVIEGETGFLVEVGDVDAIADRMVALLSDPSLRERMGAAGRTRVHGNYLVGDKMDELTEIWQRTSGNAR